MADMLNNYEEYDKKLKEAISVMVTSPDPKDGHTHVAYVDKNGNGMTSCYPENEEDYWQHCHVIVNKNIVPSIKGYGISFHTGLQDMSEAELKSTKTILSQASDVKSTALRSFFNKELKESGMKNG